MDLYVQFWVNICVGVASTRLRKVSKLWLSFNYVIYRRTFLQQFLFSMSKLHFLKKYSSITLFPIQLYLLVYMTWKCTPKNKVVACNIIMYQSNTWKCLYMYMYIHFMYMYIQSCIAYKPYISNHVHVLYMYAHQCTNGSL